MARAFAPSASDPEPDSLSACADGLARQEFREVSLFLRFGAEEKQRDHCEVCLRAEARAERRRVRQLLADDDRRHLVEADAAVDLGDVDAEQTEIAAAAHQFARERPVLLFEPIELWHHLVVDELPRRLADQAMFLGQAFRREDGVGVRRFEQPCAAAQNRDRR